MSTLHALMHQYCACRRGRPSGLVSIDLTLSVSSRCYKRLSTAVKSAFLPIMTVNLASQMHINALHCIAQLQPATTVLDRA